MSFYFAIMLGLIGSSHCFAMCGGLFCAINLQPEHQMRTTLQHSLHNLCIQSGRITTYIALGIIVSILARWFNQTFSIPHWGNAMRWLLLCGMLLIGIQLIWQRSPLQYIEQLVRQFWRNHNQPFKKLLPAKTLGDSYKLGLLWGLLPCSLIYGLLITAMASNSILDSGLIMLGFGIGTLPALFLTGLSAAHINRYINQLRLRQISGGLILCAVSWTLILPLLVNHTDLYISPYFQNLALCKIS